MYVPRVYGLTHLTPEGVASTQRVALIAFLVGLREKRIVMLL